MISICTCAINANNRVKLFLEMLAKLNIDCLYEVCLVVDTRFDPNKNTLKFYEELQNQYQNLKLIEFSKKDCVEYLVQILGYYYQTKLFPPEYLYDLNHNFLLYKQDQLCDTNKEYLWISSGHLYNKAAAISSGEILIFTPGELIYFLKLNELQTLINLQKENDIFYAKPNVIFLPLLKKDNLILDYFPKETILSEVFLETNEMIPEELFVPDIFKEEYINLGDSLFFDKVLSVAKDAHKNNNRNIYLNQCHGFHAMTKKTYDEIGGFTEEWFGRAWSDDRMSSLGKKIYDKFVLSYRYNICHYNCNSQNNNVHLYSNKYSHADFQKYFEKLRYEKPVRFK